MRSFQIVQLPEQLRVPFIGVRHFALLKKLRSRQIFCRVSQSRKFTGLSPELNCGERIILFLEPIYISSKCHGRSVGDVSLFASRLPASLQSLRNPSKRRNPKLSANPRHGGRFLAGGHDKRLGWRNHAPSVQQPHPLLTATRQDRADGRTLVPHGAFQSFLRCVHPFRFVTHARTLKTQQNP